MADAPPGFVRVDENGNPIAPSPATASSAPPGFVRVDETGNPIAAATATAPQGQDWFHQYVTPHLPSFFSAPATDASGQPEYLTPALSPEADANVRAGSNLAARTLLRANPVLAIPNALVVGSQLAGDALNRKLGVTPADAPAQQPFNPLERGIDALGFSMDKDAGKPMQIADAVAPWLIPTGNQVGRVQEAPGAFNKVATAGRSLMGNMADWAISDEFQKQAQAQGWGPLAQMVASAVGGNVRQGIARVGATQAPKVVPPKPDGGGAVDFSKQLLPPPGSDVSTLPPFRDVADPNSSIASWLSGASSLPFAGTGEASAVKAQTGAIARTMDKGLQGLDPGATPVMNAGPASLQGEAYRLSKGAQDKIFNTEQDLKARSDAIESQIGKSTRVDAAPLLNAVDEIYTSPDVGPTAQAAARSIRTNLLNMIGPDGKASFGALKTEHSALMRHVDNLFQNSTGDADARNAIAKEIKPVEDAMGEGMATAADSVNPQLGDDYRQLNAEWSTHGAVKHALADVGGVLGPGGRKFVTRPGAANVSHLLDTAVRGSSTEGTLPIEQIEAGLGERQARSAVAETIASRARPKNAIATQGFRPDVMGEGVDARVDPAIMHWVEEKAGPQSRQNIENAAAAGRATSEPNRVGGWKKAFGSVISAAPYVGATAAVLKPTGAAALSPLALLVTSMSHDPDFIRAVANRRIPLTSRDLAMQMATHAALGSQPGAVDPAEALRYGIGQGANAIAAGARGGLGLVPTLMRYVNQPGPANTRP